MSESCETCRFWRQDECVRGVLCGAHGRDFPSVGGYCRRNAPLAAGYFPATASADWCGEYEFGGGVVDEANQRRAATKINEVED